VLELRVLGPFEAVLDGEPVAIGGPKQRSVLALLAVDVGRVVSVDRLIEGVWGEEAPDGARRSLQVYVSNLRKALAPAGGGDSVLVARSPGYLLDVDPDRVDAVRHASLVAEAREARAGGRHGEARARLADADALWRGEPLADLAFEPFAGPVVARLAEERADAAEDRAEAEIACGGHVDAVATLERMVEEAPLRERRWGLLMLAQYRSGRQAEALRTYGRARDTLVDELGIDPGPALRDLESRILVQDPDLAAAPEAATAAPRARSRPDLPVPPSPIVGRAREVDDVSGSLRDADVRMVTLTGPGGVGKTRLAMEVGPVVVDDFPGGVVFVPLTAVDDPERVLPLAGGALGVAEPADGDWTAAVAARIGDEPTLVVLDNLEQLQDAAGDVAALLAAAPGLTVLATSRVALRVAGEQEYVVGPLPVDDDAVALFLERSLARVPGYASSDDDRAAVAAICARVDGLPLALELAAARAKVLAPRDLLARLDDTLGLLVGGGRDLPDRQRTLRATLAWSYALLEPTDRDLLDRLSVFAGSFTVEAAEAVCAFAGDVDVLDGLSVLVDNSLVRPLDADGASLRFGLLQTVRDFARERLLSSGHAGEVRDRHAAEIVRAAEAARPAIDSTGSAVVLALLRADEANHRSAMEHLLERGRLGDAARLAVALRPFWVGRGLFADGRRWLGRILADDGLEGDQRAPAAVAAGILAYYQDDLDDAVARLTEGSDRARRGAAPGAEPADPETTALALCFLASCHLFADDREAATVAIDEALALAEAHELYEPHALALSASAIAAAMAGDFDGERAAHERRLELVRRRGDRERVADTLNTLAEIALEAEDHEQAGRLAEEGLGLVGADSRLTRRDLRLTLGRVALAGRDAEGAARHLREALVHCTDLAQPFELAQCVRAVAGVASLRGDADAAVRLVAAVEEPPDDDDEGGAFPPAPDLLAWYEAATETLGDAAAAAARAGSLLSRDEAVALAREVLAG